MIDALKLMRIPFSIFLMPVYWFSLSNLEDINVQTAMHIFILLHVLVYPASNGYNSYFDRDEGSIGGLEKPPQVNQFLFPLVVLFDITAILYALWINLTFGVLITIYLFVSKAYSYDKIRLKKYALLSTGIVTIFQGGFIFICVLVGLDIPFIDSLKPDFLIPATCSTLFLLGSYPLTQIYQHEEDAARGDQTLSLKLGIKGTFIFAEICFALGFICISAFYYSIAAWSNIFIFIGLGLPILIYFQKWKSKCLKSGEVAHFKDAMKMNQISSLCLSAAFILMIFY